MHFVLYSNGRLGEVSPSLFNRNEKGVCFEQDCAGSSMAQLDEKCKNVWVSDYHLSLLLVWGANINGCIGVLERRGSTVDGTGRSTKVTAICKFYHILVRGINKLHRVQILETIVFTHFALCTGTFFLLVAFHPCEGVLHPSSHVGHGNPHHIPHSQYAPGVHFYTF